MKNQKGFSLVELLVVVIIIAIIAAIAIPNLLASRRAANEASAINSLRTIHSAQVTYFATENNTYGTLTNLGPAEAGLIDSALASGTKSGYTIVSTPASDAYCATAVPIGTAGDRSFAVSTQGVVVEGVCTAGVATGTPVGSAPAATPTPTP